MNNTIQDLFISLRSYIDEHQETKSNMMTVYANLDPSDYTNQRERPAWMIELKNQFDMLTPEQKQDAENAVGTALTWEYIEEKTLEAFLAHEPKGKGAMILTDFVDGMIVDLPLPVENRVYFGLPQVSQLLSQLHRYGKYLVVLFSEKEHRVISVNLNTNGSEQIVDSGSVNGVFLRPGGKKSRTQASERRDLDTEKRIYNSAAEEINAFFMDDTDFDRIILGGNLKIAKQVASELHHSVAERLVSIEPIPFKVAENDLKRMVRVIADEYEEVQDASLVQELLIRQNTCDRSAFGLDAVMTALENGQVRRIYLPHPVDAQKFNMVLVEAMANNVDVEILHGDAAERLNALGGVAATLYYTF
ncbi:hypothetical protein JCM19239_4272 [Vibrio variabilis]|uniref:Peptide chain release factor 1 n=1 Tax=Vibrio variabilis TaxID=990271 RepID=A0ABQ0JAJ6_9VIBR|nr:hypothetical protein JCM19239_4272 [Vibrio variabilis]